MQSRYLWSLQTTQSLPLVYIYGKSQLENIIKEQIIELLKNAGLLK